MMRLIIALLATSLFTGQSHSATTDVSLSIDAAGKISAEIRLPAASSPTAAASAPFSLYVLALPFRISEAVRLQGPEDVPVAILKRGEGYTLISAAIPSSRPDTILRVADAFSLSESSEGKAYLPLDLNYPFISQADRQLLGANFSALPGKILIALPREFDETAIGVSPYQFQRLDKRQYLLDLQAIAPPPAKAWLVFPNPMQSQLQIAKIVLAGLIGVFTLLIHLPALKEERLSWSLTVLAISSIVCGLVLYYSFSLSKRLEFIEWAAGSAPHVIYGLATSLYLIIVVRCQSLITGRITLDGSPIQIAEVKLWRVANGSRQQEAVVETLGAEGRYSFRTRPKVSGERFEVTATARGAEDASTGEFEVEPGKRLELKAMNLQWRQIQTQASLVVPAVAP